MAVILTVVFVLLLIALVGFWIAQFAQLMTLGDQDFPGRHDKILWVVAMIVLTIFAAIAFAWWKRIMLATKEIEKESRS